MGEPIRVEVQGSSSTTRGGGILGFLMLTPGLGLIAFGVALFIWEDLLRYVVAAVFILAGLGLMILARKIGRARSRMSSFQASFMGGPGGPFGADPRD